MIAHNCRIRERFLDRCDVAFPDVGTNCGNAAAESGGDRQQSGQHGGLQLIGQHGQHMQFFTFAQSADHGYKITMVFEEGYLVDTQSCEPLQSVPLHTACNPVVEDAQK